MGISSLKLSFYPLAPSVSTDHKGKGKKESRAVSGVTKVKKCYPSDIDLKKKGIQSIQDEMPFMGVLIACSDLN